MTSKLKVDTNQRNAFFNTETQNKIENLPAEFVNAGTDDPKAIALAHEAAEAQIMLERVRVARRWAWEEACHDRSIEERGIFFPTFTETQFLKIAECLSVASNALDESRRMRLKRLSK